MAREYFKCFHSYFEKTKSLTDAEVGRLFRALLKFSATGEAPSLAGRESIAFDFIADEIVRDQEAYANLCRQNAENRAQRPSTTVHDRQRNATEWYETDKVKGKRNIKEISSKEDTKKSTAFHAPTLEEVKARCAEKGYTLDPEAFMAYYNANGWKVGRNKMVSWESALAWWESREKQYRKPAKQNAALKYEQKPIPEDNFNAMVVDLTGGDYESC